MDEYDIRQPEQLCCAVCDRPVPGGDIVFCAGGQWLCRECIADYIAGNWLVYEIADALDIVYRPAADVLQWD